MRSIWSGRSALYEALVAAIKASAAPPQPEHAPPAIPQSETGHPHGGAFEGRIQYVPTRLWDVGRRRDPGDEL